MLTSYSPNRKREQMASLNHLIFFACLHFILSPNILPSAAYTLKHSESIKDGQSLISQGGTFKLGFFTPSTTSNNRYLGIWYNTIPTQTVVWVANRDSPLTDTSGVLRISSAGSLVLVGNQTQSIIWSSNTSKTEENLVVEFFESGNLVLRNVDSGTYLWQSFDFPGNTLLPGIKMGWSFKTGKSWYLSSWRSSDDPSSGNFTLGMEKTGYIEVIMMTNESHKYARRSGLRPGLQFSDNIVRYEFIRNAAETYFTYQTLNKYLLMRLVLTEARNEGYLDHLRWVESTNKWFSFLNYPRERCDYYAVCGAYSICEETTVSLCQCLNHFKPRSPQDWSQLLWTKGCENEVPINCSKGEGFRKYSSIKLPDTEFSLVDASMNLEECRIKCLSNCACTAYSPSDVNGSGCIMWLKELIDMAKITTGGQDLYIRMAASELDPEASSRTKESMILIVSIASIVVVAMLCLGGLCFCKRRRSKGGNGNGDLELPLYDLETIKRATNNFSEENKLGKGGFGPVYKGTLEGGQKIAVKRLAKNSTQGIDEFENEVILISKLRHRNLVRLLGYCIQGEEKMLLYEYMQNKSLDIYIFDDKHRRLLDWQKRFHIILGIARGLLYLHHDSIVRIIHRDLKASNVLLDGDMIPKISDFGLARICGGDQVEGETKRVVGTFGYMSPEYANDGHFSVKSDVYSFGVLLLEIISGKKNRAFCHPDHDHNLLGHAWILWSEDKSVELVDEFVRYSCCVEEVMRCIHVGLLCVQQSSERRPTMSSVLLMLSSSGKLPVPQSPGFYVGRSTPSTDISLYGEEKLMTSNGVTITLLEGR